MYTVQYDADILHTCFVIGVLLWNIRSFIKIKFVTGIEIWQNHILHFLKGLFNLKKKNNVFVFYDLEQLYRICSTSEEISNISPPLVLIHLFLSLKNSGAETGDKSFFWQEPQMPRRDGSGSSYDQLFSSEIKILLENS